MCDLRIDDDLACVLGILRPETTIVQDCERLMALPKPEPVPDPPCIYCRPGTTCWFHRPFIHGAK